MDGRYYIIVAIESGAVRASLMYVCGPSLTVSTAHISYRVRVRQSAYRITRLCFHTQNIRRVTNSDCRRMTAGTVVTCYASRL